MDKTLREFVISRSPVRVGPPAPFKTSRLSGAASVGRSGQTSDTSRDLWGESTRSRHELDLDPATIERLAPVLVTATLILAAAVYLIPKLLAWRDAYLAALGQ